ncbi:hypothetical protein [Clostridium botulinum]|uniref:hypothetical protein n=1 Tax=Clostridium botulinum TaxID=1491 RepID=UPI0005845227|nr:hypothetical protein [Clostridium botulinum]AJE10005.1 hypothetical protein T259_1924 [Clostridium botulinum CDC_1436]AJE12547.1 hypothetical protein T259_1748 [Clostridium botulinum CDC_1436]MBY6879729.1 hypothetical protein [Clostridium botulinum]NFB02589.1 hypothetical protein [Clostridium botulinum]HDI3055721.1 hypothetical protein [Clostridium botulinum]
MSWIDEILDRALENIKKYLKEKDKPLKRYKKRVKNRNILYKKRMKLGRVKRKVRGGNHGGK